jgi:Flp pilus assembly protein TadG
MARARAGNFSIFLAASVMVLLGFAALVIDVSYLRLARMQAQYAADAAALGGLYSLAQTGDQAEAQAVAEELVDLNFVAGPGATASRTVEFGEWDYAGNFLPSGTANAIRVRVARDPLDLTLMNLFGTPSSSSAAGDGVAAVQPVDIVIVQDVTGSFADEIGDARQADRCFLQAMDRRQSPWVRLGMTTFTGGAVEFSPLQVVQENYAAMDAKWATLDWCHKPGSTRTQMMSCAYQSNTHPVGANWRDGTNQGDGIWFARNMLRDAASTGKPTMKIMIVVSDGRPQCSPDNPTCRAAREAWGQEQATAAWEEDGIHIYSVFFHTSPSSSELQYMDDLTKGIGTRDGLGAYYTPDSAELASILVEIADQIPLVLVK